MEYEHVPQGRWASAISIVNIQQALVRTLHIRQASRVVCCVVASGVADRGVITCTGVPDTTQRQGDVNTVPTYAISTFTQTSCYDVCVTLAAPNGPRPSSCLRGADYIG